ncbi:hypothetical protein [Pseudomonas serbica]|jgi:hypothetical protein|uniref:hypothetical protein n=1 Tax=Pseudomonas serbica TaxID=2965074 RepID=UPI00237BC496|nr:hypothetical protein [Pseudomonas serbica]
MRRNYTDERFQESYNVMTPVLSTDAYYKRLLDIATEGKEKLFASEPEGETRTELHTKAFKNLFGQYLDDNHTEIQQGEPATIVKGLQFLRRLLSPGGPYADLPLTGGYSCLDFDEIPRYAQLAHLVIKEPATFGHLRETVFKDLIHHQLQYPGRFQSMVKAMDKLSQIEPTLSIHEAIADMETNIHDNFRSYVTMAAFQEKGGLARLLERGADIPKTLQACLEIVEGTEANNKSFASMFRLTLDCIQHLEAKEGISLEDARASRSQLLRNALEVSGRQKNKDAKVWSPIIRELAGAVDSSLQPRHLLSYLHYLTLDEIDPSALKLIAEVDPKLFKKSLKRDYLEPVRFGVIHKAGFKHLFSENELLVMCGHQFAADLGL